MEYIKQKLEFIIELLLMILLVLVFVFVMLVILFNTGDKDCKDYCNSYGTIFSEIKHTGEWGRDDLCVCFKEDNSIITWRMPK